MKRKNSSKKIIIYSMTGNFLIFLAKAFVFLITGSPSMLAEAVHSIVDTGNQGCLYIGNIISQKQPTRENPLGGGIGQYLWNLIAAIGIFFFGAGVTVYHGVDSLFNPVEITDAFIYAIIILIFSLVIEGFIFSKALKEVNKSRKNKNWIKFLKECEDPTILGVLLEDGVAVFSIVLALIGIGVSHYTGDHYFDSIAAILIGSLLAFMAFILFKINSRLILGAALPEEEEQKIIRFLEKLKGVEKVVRLSTHIIGPKKYSLEAEIELESTEIIDPNLIKMEAIEIKENPERVAQILVDVADRSYRKVGKITDEIESKVFKKFPKIKLIRIEIN